MVETVDNINENTFNNLSRNTPVALVVGAAGFLGSNLIDTLLAHNIQVIGVDDFSAGLKDNLNSATKNNKFHLINAHAHEFNFKLSRLDYIFFVASDLKHVNNYLSLAKEHTSKIVLVSSINLYDKKQSFGLTWVYNLETQIAKFAKENNLNVRIVRLAPVFGPRMHFREKDPIIRLIQASLLGKLQNESTSLEFSSRAIFIDDAVKLIIKSMLGGSTAQKIFDGSLPQPIQVSEVKQILMDPVWYEQKGFNLTELPPWPTPNLKSTMSHLNWKPETNIIEALRKTISYFKEGTGNIPDLTGDGEEFDKGWWEKEKERRLKAEGEQNLKSITNPKNENKLKVIKPKFSFAINKNQLFAALGLVIIFYALFFPLFTLTAGVIAYRYNIDSFSKNLKKGEYDKGLQDINRADSGVNLAKDLVDGLTVFSKLGFLSREFSDLNNVLGESLKLAFALKHLAEGTRLLNGGFKATTNGFTEIKYFNDALAHYQLSEESLSRIKLGLDSSEFKNIPTLNERVVDLKKKVVYFEKLAIYGKISSIILQEALSGKKTYLLVLQNNLLLKPTGGKIISLAQIDFEDGKLKKTAVQSAADLDNLVKEVVEPPKEINEDLGKSTYLLSDSNWEPDFPTTASQINFFFKKITGKEVDGVIAIDVEVIRYILTATGPVEIEGSGKIDSENIVEKAARGDDKLLIGLQKEILNRLFFGAKGVLPQTGEALINSLERKHIMVAFFEPKLANIVKSANFSGVLTDDSGAGNDFLAVIESNISNNFIGDSITRKFNMKTIIDNDVNIESSLSIGYTNTNVDGVYKSRVRIYLPGGTKLKSLTFGETDYKNRVSTFSDFGKTGYSFVISLGPGEQKLLKIEYQIPLKFKEIYKINVFKQAGTKDEVFNVEIQKARISKQFSLDFIKDLQIEF